MKKRKISIPYQESNPGSSVVQPVAQAIDKLSYTG
jgi:hypothetical protein